MNKKIGRNFTDLKVKIITNPILTHYYFFYVKIWNLFRENRWGTLKFRYIRRISIYLRTFSILYEKNNNRVKIGKISTDLSINEKSQVLYLFISYFLLFSIEKKFSVDILRLCINTGSLKAENISRLIDYLITSLTYIYSCLIKI